VRKSAWVRFFVAVVIVLSVVVLCALNLGEFLVVDHPERSDVIVVLAGDHNDLRYWHGLEMLREGYARNMMIDVPAGTMYGRTREEYAADFVSRSAGDNKSQVSQCTIQNDSTIQESADVARCLTQSYPGSWSVLIVTSEFHTRRALLILRSQLRQYRWSVSAVSDPSMFGKSWWRHREWAKTCIYEWEKLIWWALGESWRQ
jgi:DUF218 domain